MPPRTPKEAPTGAARIPKASMGFYRDPSQPGLKYRRVTTILDQGVPAAGLKFWFGNTVADSAIANLPMLVQASMSRAATEQARDWLRRAPTQAKDERAELGSAVHSAIEAKILETAYPESDDPEVVDCLRHFERFVSDWAVEFSASEMVVANDGQHYAGTLDALLRSPLIAERIGDCSPELDIMFDVKTGGTICWAGGENGDGAIQAAGECIRVRPSEWKNCPGIPHPVKGVYGSAALQQAAYRACNRAWLRDGTTVDMPATCSTGVVLHLRPDGYLVVPVLCDESVYAVFTHAIQIAEWSSSTEKTVVGNPLSKES